MKKRLFLVLYTSLFVVTIFGQDFKGVIVNAKQRPLKGMKVWKKNTTESVQTIWEYSLFPVYSPQIHW